MILSENRNPYKRNANNLIEKNLSLDSKIESKSILIYEIILTNKNGNVKNLNILPTTYLETRPGSMLYKMLPFIDNAEKNSLVRPGIFSTVHNAESHVIHLTFNLMKKQNVENNF